ncbi:hypothetical protein ACFOY2_21920 [Nonomuraea purpurea]|uniref:Uncharacterized protein n=1 Tax=Nonomuraea purpurea TaxID=1849276 RepID=A0ABV8G7G3_9ACTN
MALRMTWRSYSVGQDDLVTVYWFPRESDWRMGYVARALGVSLLSHEQVDARGTSDEIDGWAAAATAYVDEVATAAAELERVQLLNRRWRDWPVVRRWAEAKYDEAKASYLDRVRAATSAYQPVRDVVEQRIAEREAVLLARKERAQQKEGRRQRESEARFQEWERRQAGPTSPCPVGSPHASWRPAATTRRVGLRRWKRWWTTSTRGGRAFARRYATSRPAQKPSGG